MKNIGNFKSHICKSCTSYPKSQAQAIVKLCTSCDKKSTVLEDLVSMDYFSLFNLKLKFNLDKKSIDKEYRALQKIVHPDLITSLNDNEAIKEAESASSYISKSYETLKNDYERAKFMLSLVNINTDNITISQEELEDLIEMNLEIDDCEDMNQIAKIYSDILEMKNNLVNSINDEFDNNLLVGCASIKEFIQKYNNQSGKIDFSFLAKLVNKLKFVSNALEKAEEKQSIIKKNPILKKNKML